MTRAQPPAYSVVAASFALALDHAQTAQAEHLEAIVELRGAQQYLCAEHTAQTAALADLEATLRAILRAPNLERAHLLTRAALDAHFTPHTGKPKP